MSPGSTGWLLSNICSSRVVGAVCQVNGVPLPLCGQHRDVTPSVLGRDESGPSVSRGWEEGEEADKNE